MSAITTAVDDDNIKSRWQQRVAVVTATAVYNGCGNMLCGDVLYDDTLPSGHLPLRQDNTIPLCGGTLTLVSVTLSLYTLAPLLKGTMKKKREKESMRKQKQSEKQKQSNTYRSSAW